MESPTPAAPPPVLRNPRPNRLQPLTLLLPPTCRPPRPAMTSLLLLARREILKRTEKRTGPPLSFWLSPFFLHTTRHLTASGFRVRHDE